MSLITSVGELRQRYAAPGERALRKQLAALDRHCRDFIALSPFVVLSSAGADGRLDASPRGGAPGFVKTPSETLLLLPDAPGNNRLDSLENIVQVGRVGLLFLIPGVDETLRVNGRAVLSTDAQDIAACSDDRRAPKLVIRLSVEEAYLHCAKALMRSKLWSDQVRVPRSVLPSMGQMISDQTGATGAPESQEAMVQRYQADL